MKIKHRRLLPALAGLAALAAVAPVSAHRPGSGSNPPPGAYNVNDLYDPDINANVIPRSNPGDPTSLALAGPTNPTAALAAVETYDSIKVKAILNKIDGKTHDGSPAVHVPAIFGMNFQTVSVGQKLQQDASDHRQGGYTDNGLSPTPLLTDALNYIDAHIGLFVNEINARSLANSTVIIITSKHGQTPTDLNNLLKIKQSKVDAVVGSALTFDKTDDISLLWLTSGDPVQVFNVVNSLRNANGTAGGGNPATSGTPNNFSTPYGATSRY